jgi:4-amino-4-deoxy-L-arabinose transferase-like glycosyltransferase
LRTRDALSLLLVAALVLLATAWLRSAEYDEQYTMFLTAGVARPAWPTNAFAAGEMQALQSAHPGFAAIADDLRRTDVHPPLYFWVAAAWRDMAGGGLFALRLLSVLCSLATLCAVALLARRAGIPAGLAVLLTLGCYGFTYTGSIARGFALAQLLSVLGVALLLRAEQRNAAWPAVAAGLLFGAASFANYLAAFVGIGALLWLLFAALLHHRRSGFAARTIAATAGFAVWLPADLWFFIAQRHSRADQFPVFDAMADVMRLARYAAANVLGGLPLYVGGLTRSLVSVAMALLAMALLALTIQGWRRIATPGTRWLLAATLAAPPIGLLVLGLLNNNRPIELRYLAFATPFAGLLLAGALATLPARLRHVACATVLTIQGAALVGLMTRPETMQPARRTATAAAALVQDGVVLLPNGNDGIGIVSAFAIEAPPAMRLLVIRRDDSPERIRARSDGFQRVVLALLDVDQDGRATLPSMRQAFADPCWRKIGEGFNVVAFERTGGQGASPTLPHCARKNCLP